MRHLDTVDVQAEHPQRAAARARWRTRRIQMEAEDVVFRPDGATRRRHWLQFMKLTAVFGVLLRICGLYRRGVRNALDIRLSELELRFPDLPSDFDGFRILLIADPHIDMQPEVMDRVSGLIAGLDYDLCVLAGDYRRRVSGPYRQVMPAVAKLVSELTARHGIFAVLGNHDCADMAEAFEELGISMLVNETQEVHRGASRIHLTGTDDVHYFYTDAARTALASSPDGFKIALIHSAELADVAADHGYALYLAGHTHGGQICLPGGIPVITQMTRFRKYASGQWKRASMLGYTSSGAGTSALPVRYNTRGEIALITLRRH